MEHMPISLRTSFPVRSSWVQGEKSERIRGVSPIPPVQLTVLAHSEPLADDEPTIHVMSRDIVTVCLTTSFHVMLRRVSGTW